MQLPSVTHLSLGLALWDALAQASPYELVARGPAVDAETAGSVGPLFAEALAANSVSDVATAAAAKGCLLTCGRVVVRALPCVIKAIATSNPTVLFTCGLRKKEICECLRCLPAKFRKWIDKNVCSTTRFANVEPTTELDNVNVTSIPDLNIKAALGLVTKDEVAVANRLGINSGSPCGSNPTVCIGICADGVCIGHGAVPVAVA